MRVRLQPILKAAPATVVFTLALAVVVHTVQPWQGEARAACCYFSAQGQDVQQPAQKAFITWDPEGEQESFTVQPRFEGDAEDFGMVIPTPSKPKLDEMPRDFFKALATFTILEPMDLSKYKAIQFAARAGSGKTTGVAPRRRVTVLEAGVV